MSGGDPGELLITFASFCFWIAQAEIFVVVDAGQSRGAATWTAGLLAVPDYLRGNLARQGYL